MKVPQFPHLSLRSRVLGLIENALLDGELQPGDRIIESEIAQKAGISRAPVREAIRELVGEGILVSYPSKGTFVSQWSPRAVEEAYTLRADLERFAVEQAIRQMSPDDIDRLQGIVHDMAEATRKGDTRALVRLDVRFHQMLWELSGHSLLQETLARLGRRLHCLQAIDVGFVVYRDEVAPDHQRLVDAVRTGDPTVAGEAMAAHVLSNGAVVIEQAKQWAEKRC